MEQNNQILSAIEFLNKPDTIFKELKIHKIRL